MQNILKILTGNWKKIIAITILTTALSVGFGFIYNKTAYNNTIFINIGAGQSNSQNRETSPFESIQAADAFTETVQGWFKNPVLIEQIRAGAQFNVDLSVRKQEKQNLLVTFKTESAEQGKKVALVTEETIRAQIGKYNRETGADFNIPTSDVFSKVGTINLAVFAVMGAVMGFILAYFLSALLQKFISELNQFRHGKPWI